MGSAGLELTGKMGAAGLDLGKMGLSATASLSGLLGREDKDGAQVGSALQWFNFFRPVQR